MSEVSNITISVNREGCQLCTNATCTEILHGWDGGLVVGTGLLVVVGL